MATRGDGGHPLPVIVGERYLTRREAAEIAGVTERTIDRAIERGDLVAGQPHGRYGFVRIRRADLEAWIGRRGGREDLR